MRKRVISALMAVFMSFELLSVNVMATEPKPYDFTQNAESSDESPMAAKQAQDHDDEAEETVDHNGSPIDQAYNETSADNNEADDAPANEEEILEEVNEDALGDGSTHEDAASSLYSETGTTSASNEAAAEKAESDSSSDSSIEMSDGTVSYADVPKTWGGDIMGLTAALENAVPTDNTITVAVIDTGINASHEWFSGRISGGKSLVGEGYADDNGHGSHVAGIIAANTPDNVKILPIKALNAKMTGTADDIGEAIRYAVDQGADIINLSLGFSKNSIEDEALYSDCAALLSSAISYARDKGCFIVTSAGNENGNIEENGSYPANSPNVITVAAISDDKSRYTFSNYGGEVDFCAPGEDIYSAWKGAPSYQQLSGTSMAAPFVSAALAWVMLYNPDKDPVSILGDCCEDLGDSADYGRGLPVFEDGIVPGADQDMPERPVIKKSDCDGNCILLEWNNPDGCMFFVYRSEQGQEDFALIGASDEGTYSDAGKGLVPGTTYRYKIEAVTEGFYKDCTSEERTQEYYIPILNVTIYVDGKEYSNYKTIEVGETHKVSLKIEPENATYQQIEWKSKDSDVVSVDQEGIVIGKKNGDAWVYALIKNYCSEIIVSFTVANNELCGDNLFWTISEDGTELEIFGEGDMYDFSSIAAPAPWHKYSDSITKIIIGDNVRTIGKFAFDGLYKVKTIEGMRGVEEIHSYAFQRCTGTISLPNNVNLDDFTFHDASFDRLVIPSQIRSSSPLAWFDSEVNEYLVSEDNEIYSSEEGVLFNKDKTELLDFPLSRTGAYSIPDSVKTISEAAFKYCAIQEVSIPDSVTEISRGAFSFCDFEEIRIPSSIDRIYDGTFMDCRRLRKVELPDHLDRISRGAFMNCESLKEIKLPDTLKFIEDEAFAYSALESICIPESVIDLFPEIFKNCSKLKSVTFEGKRSRLSFGIFYNCSSLEEIVLPGTLERIESYKSSFGENLECFYGCDNLKTVYFGGFIKQFDAIENLDRNPNLKQADLRIDMNGTFGDLTWHVTGNGDDLLTLTISGTGAMPDFRSPDQVPWKDGLDEIKHVVIEDGVTHIGSYAFYRMENLEDVKLPSNVTSYGKSVFRSDPKLETFHHDNGNPEGQLHISVQYLVAKYTGNEFKPEIIVEKGLPGDTGSWEMLTENTDFTVEYKNTRNIGEGSIVIHFTGDYSSAGDVTIPFIVVAEFLKGENIKALSKMEVAPTEFTYNRNLQGPKIIVYSGRWKLTDTYYTLTGDKSRNKGNYEIKAEGVGPYAGSSISEWFRIKPANINDLRITGQEGTFVYDGKAKEPIKIEGLDKGTDYDVSYENNVEPGTASATITGKGNYTGTCEKEFNIKKRSLSDAQMKLSPASFKYDGNPHTPTSITLTYDGKVLEEGTDYEIESRPEGKDVGEYSITANGKGHYEGTRTGAFTIIKSTDEEKPKKRSLPGIELSWTSVEYDGSRQVPAVTLRDGSILKEGTDYVVDRPYSTNAGSYTIKVTGRGDYEGNATAKYEITRADIARYRNTAGLKRDTFSYDGKAKEPELSFPGFTKGKDYEIAYANNTNAGTGTAKVIVTGIGNYKGSFELYFTITPADEKVLTLTSIMLSKDHYTYDGSKHTPDAEVWSDDRLLTEGTDYRLRFSGNMTDIGTYTVTAEGTGDYKGTVTETFTIRSRSMSSISEDMIALSRSEFTYDGTEKQPVLTIEGMELDKDYTLSYIDNTQPGTATVIATGIGNYSGEITRTFVIKESEVSDTGKTAEEAEAEAETSQSPQQKETESYDTGAVENSAGACCARSNRIGFGGCAGLVLYRVETQERGRGERRRSDVM